MEHKQKITVAHPHGDHEVEIHGKNLEQPKGVNIVGGGGKAGKPVTILSKRPEKNDA